MYLGNTIENGELVEVSKTIWNGPHPYKVLTSTSFYEEFKRTHIIASGGYGKKASSRPVFSSSADFYLTGDDSEGYMKLECCWDRSNVFLESPPPDSEIKLKICLMKGDTR